MPSAWRVRVYYEDTDLSGVAYHANYLRWLERGRTEWLRGRGFSQQYLLENSGFVFTVARMELRFQKPARLDEELDVQTEVSDARRVTLSFDQRIVRPGDAQTLCTANVKVACVDARNFRPRSIPQELLKSVEGDLLQGEKF